MSKYICLLLLLTGSLAACALQSWAYSAPRETVIAQSDEQGDSDEEADSDDFYESDTDTENRDDSLENADGPDEGPIIGDEDNRPKER